MSLYDEASLVMIPSGYKEDKLYSIKPTSGDGDFTFSRGTDTATRVNASGLIEKERGNLLLQSNSFDTTWTLTSSISLTGGQSGYDGTNDAWLLKRSDTSARRIQQVITPSGVQTYSVYAKAESVDWLLLFAFDGSSSYDAYFDLASGVVGTKTNLIDAKIESVGNGFYRCSITYNAAITFVRIYPAVADGNITGGISPAGIYIQDTQLEKSLIATDYIETTTAAGYEGITDNLPRLDYSGGASCPSLLLEPQRTNLFENSEYFSASTWIGITGGVLTENDTTSPEGVQNATKIEGDGSSTAIRLYDFQNFASAGDYSLTFFAKAGTADFIQISLLGYDGGGQASFDLSNGTIDDVANGSIEDYGNGWYKCTCTKSIGATDLNGSANLYVRKSFTSNWDNAAEANGKYVYIYGAQLEQGSYPTSYIPTYGTSATRAADSCSKTGISSLIGQTEGTLFAEVDFDAISEGARFVQISDGTNNNRMYIGVSSTNTIVLYLFSGGTNVVSISSSVYTSQTIKVAAGYANNDFVLYVNGVQIGTDTSGSVQAMDEVSVGYNNIANNRHTAYGTKQALLFKTRLTNAELAALTTL